MQIQREFSDPRIVDMLTTRDEAWIVHALMEADEIETLKERVTEADAPDREPGIDSRKAFSVLKEKYAS